MMNKPTVEEVWVALGKLIEEGHAYREVVVEIEEVWDGGLEIVRRELDRILTYEGDDSVVFKVEDVPRSGITKDWTMLVRIKDDDSVVVETICGDGEFKEWDEAMEFSNKVLKERVW